jgi:hypothetical protein
MRRKLSLGVLAALVLTVASVTLASASSSRSPDSANSDETHIIKLRAEHRQETSIDLGEEGFGQGDQIVFRDVLFRDGKRVGTGGVTCTVIFVSGNQQTVQLQCVGTLSLPQGQITLQGLPNIGDSFFLAITGGTGAYRTAHGQAKVVTLSDTEDQYTLQLIL